MNEGIPRSLLELVNQVRSHRGRPALERLEPAARLREDLGLDSLDMAELTVRIEERHGVDVFAQGVVTQWGELQERVERHAIRRTR